MEKTPKELLQERLDGNYQDYLAKLQEKPVSEVIALASEITAAKQLHEELADALMDDDIQFLLKLENPLESLVGSWEVELDGVHDEEMSHMLWSMREQNLFSEEDFLPQAPDADAPQIPSKPKMDLIGHDGNIYAIMGRASGLLKDAGMKEQSDEMFRRVTSSGSYDEALHIVSEYVETELSPVAELRKKKQKKEKNAYER